MRVGVGGGNRFLRGGVSVGRGGFGARVGAGPFSLSGRGFGSGIIGAIASMIWLMMLAAFWLAWAAIVALWTFVVEPLVFDVFLPRWRQDPSPRSRAILVAAFIVPAGLLVALVPLVVPADSDSAASSGSKSGGAPSGQATDRQCTVGMNLEDCEDLAGLSAGDRLSTIDCSGKSRSVMWARNWWVIDTSGSSLVISKERSRCDA